MDFKSNRFTDNNSLPYRLIGIFFFLFFFLEAKGTTPVKLNTPLTSGQEVVPELYDISHDGNTVVYVVRGDGNDKIYKVEIDGGSPVLLHTVSESQIEITRIEIAPDDNNIAVQMENDGGLNGLYRLPMNEAGDSESVSSSNGLNVDFQWSPNGRYLVYRKSPNDAYWDYDLRSVAVPESYGTAMPDSVQLNETEGSLHDDDQFKITPNNQYVIYVADEDSSDDDDLYRVPLAGGSGPVKLSDTSHDAWTGSDSSGWKGFLLSEDGLKAVYRVWLNSEHVLYSVAISGSSPVLLDSDHRIEYIKLSNDAQYVCYGKDFGWNSSRYVLNIYSVPMSGGAPEKLNTEVFSINTGYHPDFEILPDSSRVVYENKLAATPTRVDVFSVPIAGGDRVLVRTYAHSFLISPDSSKVVCGQYEWMNVVSPLGENSQSLISGADSIKLQEITNDSTRLIWVDFDSDLDRRRLFSVPMTGDASSTELNGSMVSGGSVLSHQLADDDYIVYLADQDTDGVPELYSRALKVRWSVTMKGVTSAPWDSTGVFWRGKWIGGTPDGSSQVLIKNSAICQLDGGAKSIQSLEIEGSAEGDYDGVLDLVSDESITAPAGVTVRSRGILKGDGEISTGNGVLLIESGGKVETTTGQQLTFNGEGGTLNWGDLTATGTGEFSGEFAEMIFGGNVENYGSLEAENAKLRFNGGFKTYTNLSLNGGVTVYGDVENMQGSGGSIHIDGQNTFAGDVVNAATFDVSSGGNVIFNGAFKGYGIFTFGGSMVQLNGPVSPGFDGGDQLARMSFNDDVYLRGNAVVKMQIGGTTPTTEHDELSAGDLLTLSGTLEVYLQDGYYPDAGDRFDLFDASRISGQFSSIELPFLYPGMYWHDDQVSGAFPSEWTGELYLGIAPESYAEYATEYALDGDPQDDSDGDGVADLLEYVFATPPTLARPEHLRTHLERVGNLDKFSVNMAVPGSKDVQLEMQRSTDMQTWTTLSTRNADGGWTGSHTPSVTQVSEGLKKYQISTPVEDSKCFYRLKATQR